MTKSELQNLSIQIQSLAIFRALLDDPVIKALAGYLKTAQGEDISASVSALSPEGAVGDEGVQLISIRADINIDIIVFICPPCKSISMFTQNQT